LITLSFVLDGVIRGILYGDFFMSSYFHTIQQVEAIIQKLTKTAFRTINRMLARNIWIGKLLGNNGNNVWDIDAMEFDNDESKVYDFPKNDQCQMVYCNVGGIHWINNGSGARLTVEKSRLVAHPSRSVPSLQHNEEEEDDGNSRATTADCIRPLQPKQHLHTY
jgi:hypothetical protein